MHIITRYFSLDFTETPYNISNILYDESRKMLIMVGAMLQMNANMHNHTYIYIHTVHHLIATNNKTIALCTIIIIFQATNNFDDGNPGTIVCTLTSPQLSGAMDINPVHAVGITAICQSYDGNTIYTGINSYAHTYSHPDSI